MENNFLKGRRVLFFSVQTFSLEKKIKKSLEDFGALVDYFDERPKNSNFTKAIIRLKRSIYQNRIDKYYNKILKEISSKRYDYLFVNRGEVIPEFFLKKFINTQPHCKRIYYNWDSFENHQHPIKLLKYFQNKFSFDPQDCENFHLQFRPLFFLKSFENIKNTKDNKELDLLFLGTVHSDRYTLTKRIMNWCDDNQLSNYYFFYLQGFFVYIYRKIVDKNFEKVALTDLSFTGLITDEIIDLYRKTKVILDINHPGQRGLTMRTFESIGAERKLITTNKEIYRYKFYNPNNIIVIDRDEPFEELLLDFFNSNYEPIDTTIYESLSISGWVKSLFLESNKNIWYE